MNKQFVFKRSIALFFLLIFIADLFFPVLAYAITSGPAQPEMKQFQAADGGELVDPFTGDFKYNIPLGELDGYPLNLAYQTGSGLEDEASWVGLGWTFNPGSLTRSVRGLPDDFDGSQGDVIKREFTRKEFQKVGAQISIKASVFAHEIGQAGLKVDIYKDNYYGIGASIGADIQFNLAKNSNSPQTAGLGLSLNSDVRDGVSLSPNFSLENNFTSKEEDLMSKGGLSGGFSYNTRGGLMSTTLGISFDVGKSAEENRAILGSNGVSYFGQTYTPKIQHNTRSGGFTFSTDIGPKFFGFYFGGGGAGYHYTEKLLDKKVSKPAYGFLNYEKGRKQKDVLLDFNREKDGVFLLSNPAIASPVQTYDLYTVATHAGSYQFRPYYNGNYSVFDNQSSNASHNVSAGGTLGAGNLFQVGGRLAYTNSSTNTGKWVKNNNFLNIAENIGSLQYDDELISFRPTGDLTDRTINSPYVTKNWGNNVQAIAISNSSTGVAWKGKNNTSYGFTGPLYRQHRDYRKSVFSYLTNSQALKHGLNKNKLAELSETDSYRKGHHIGEVTVTQEDGSRLIFGLPVYNISQAEVSFSKGTDDPQAANSTRLIEYSPTTDASMQNTNLRDHMYSKDFTPAYTTSHLLTGVVSPDYIDLTNNGISEDDIGTAVKFDYTRHTKEYKWRTPFELNTANYNQGFLADPKDDKANYVYGEKEIWYLNTIESRTMIAIMVTSDRLDGYGVAGEHGGIGSTPLKKLDKIIIYRKADYLANQTTAIPVKTIHFTYDYTLNKGIPNHSSYTSGPSATGKLTLKKVHFTYGKNTRGALNPYEFSYDDRLIQEGDFPFNNEPEIQNDFYSHRSTDRWGTFKQSLFNKPGYFISMGQYVELLNNSEYPYTIQKNDLVEFMDYDERELSNRFASKWQLNKIKTPTGSVIDVEYEADDYSYVQNRRAMQMCEVVGLSDPENSQDIIESDRVVISLPMHLTGSTAEERWDQFKEIYLRQEDGKLMEYLFYKVNMDLTNENRFEYVNGYAKIDYASPGNQVSEDGASAVIVVKKTEGVHPVSFAGWQLLRTSLPQFAYDNYDNSDVEQDVNAALESIISAIGSVTELFRSFNSMAKSKKFCNNFSTGSMVRLMNPGIVNKAYAKIGGGVRVRKVVLDDQWQSIIESVEGQTLTGESTKTGKLYEYVTTKNGVEISSGVASYEPAIGNEENPFREPVPFVEKVHLGHDKYHFIEQPFCEAYFPAPVVGYSRIKITSLGHTDIESATATPLKETGWVEYEYYTAKDFPTIVEYTPIEIQRYQTSQILKIFASTSIRKIGVTQGFKVELNDMHGKPKGMMAYNKSGDNISYTKYHYYEQNSLDNVKTLKSEVDVVDPNGSIRKGILGEEIDMTSDHRESNALTAGTGAGIYFGAFSVIFGLAPFTGFNPSAHYAENDYRSVSSVKVIQRYGIIKSVETMDNGSVMQAENLLFDPLTGSVVLTKTNNEFKDPVYTFNYPAHWAYKEMGNADRNIGVIIQVPANGNLSIYSTTLNPGDELVSLDSDKKAWVIRTGNNTLRLIDQYGEYISTTERFKIVRSGRRNQLIESVGSVVMLKNPISANQLIINQSKSILNTNARLFKDEWRMAVPDLKKVEIQVGSCNPDMNCFRFLFNGAISTIVSPGRRAFFARPSDNLTVSDLLPTFHGGQCSEIMGDGVNTSDMVFYKEIDRYNEQENINLINVGDRIRFGNYYIVVEAINTLPFYQLVNSNLSESEMRLELASAAYTYQADGPEGPYDATYSKYCIKELGDCRYEFRRTNSCSFTDPIPNCETTSLCSYTSLLVFNIQPIPQEVEYCEDPLDKKINPYTVGIKGNWRPWTDFAYHVDRVQAVPGAMGQNASNLKENGYYASFTPFWTFSGGGLSSSAGTYPNISNPSDNRWVWTSQSLEYDIKGNLVESVQPTAVQFNQYDANGVSTELGMYSGAVYGYSNSQAIGIASNSRKNELMFDGFEDYNFNLTNNSTGLNCGLKRHFDWGLQHNNGNWSLNGTSIVSNEAHTGKHSLLLTGSLQITKDAGLGYPIYPFLEYGQDGTYTLTDNTAAKGFSPINGKQYVFSCWIKEPSNTNSNKINQLSITINNQTINLTNKIVPVVEGWKKLEINFTATSAFSLNMSASSALFLDDVRIHPVDAQMQTFVYDPVYMRLNAQLDENNFAQLYEYDESGTPVRIKRETEKGILTIKENRQYIRARQ
jgi:hypothetical protein